MNLTKKQIADVCENLYKYCVEQIPQVENKKIIWFLNGSTLCNMLYNVKSIDDIDVSKQFNDYCYEFIRQPKGDIDITYTPNKKYVFDFLNENVFNFQQISEEKRTYNFVDHNSEINENDLNQICKMTTKNNFSFYAKKPQYLFLYKLKELLAVYNKELFENNIDAIYNKKKNIINDCRTLYNISISYCGISKTLDVINELPFLSGYLHELHDKDLDTYNKLLNNVFNVLETEEKRMKI